MPIYQNYHYKLQTRVLCQKIAFQIINLNDIKYAKDLGYKIKLLAISEIINNKLSERVHPSLVPKKSPIGNISGVLNAVIIDSIPLGRTVIQGEGAGPGPTTSALISDLCNVLRGDVKFPFGVSSKKRKFVSSYNLNMYSKYPFSPNN